MSDNEYERFEITDYDLENEFNPNRPRKKLSKHQQIYGIWANDSDNEEYEEFSKRGHGKGRSGFSGSSNLKSKRSKDYTAPVSFVAGGVQQSGKEKETDKEKDKDINAITDEDEDNIEDEYKGFDNSVQPSIILNSDSEATSSDTDEEVKTKKSNNTSTAKSNYSSNLKMGAWEQHTRGIGAKLLLQMGYKPGKGLGKDLQGIAQPVEAYVRKGRGAIGAYGPETSACTSDKTKQSTILDESNLDSKECKEKLNKWKKTEKSNRKYAYRTVEEVLEKGKRSNYILTDKISQKLGNVPVIDMTGPEKRILSGYHALSSSKVQEEDLYEFANDNQKKSGDSSSSHVGFALPELIHNLTLIVNRCEQDIIALDTSERSAAEREAALKQEQKQLEEIIKLEQNHINTLEEALKLIDELTSNHSNLTLQRAEQIFLELQQNYTAEYKEFSLGDLAAGALAPLVKTHLGDWDPLEQPTQYVNLIKKWRTILNSNIDSQITNRSNIFDPYSSLIWAGVIPSFRTCAEHWDPKSHQVMAALLDCWAPLFPTWILDSVLEQLVLPRLCAGVRLWDPLTDIVPIHIWILPWNTILGHKMEETIFPIIRQKLGNALQAWMPQDRSARAMLTPWKEAFDIQQMEIFLMQHIIPKLQLVLSDFIINPIQQDLEPWNQVWEWHELISTVQMARLLDKHFFPKWMQVLMMWLNQSPDYVEISRWYTGWKSMLSEEILNEPSVKEHLRRALEIMHRATDTVINTNSSSRPPNASSTMGATAPPPPPPLAPQALVDLTLNVSTQLEFKELVSRKCAERGILFAPLPGRRELGKQVYRVGKLYCYIDRNVCMLSDNSFRNWTPTPLQSMLERASKRHMPSYVPKGYNDDNLWPFDCEKHPVPPYKNTQPRDMYRSKMKLQYPINVGRNIARKSANTYFILASDIELYPSKGFPTQFLKMILNNTSIIMNNGTFHKFRVFPLPVFEITKSASIPDNKLELLHMLKNKTAFSFHLKICNICHAVPGYKKWLHTNFNQYLKIVRVSKREGRFRYWEPFYVSDNFEPMFDERISWEGQHSKRIQNYAMCLLNYEYHVLHPHFLVHAPGVKKFNKNDPRLKFVPPTRRLIEKVIIPEYRILYGRNRKCKI